MLLWTYIKTTHIIEPFSYLHLAVKETLRWENIDLANNYYWIAGAKPNENQRYDLPPLIKEALLELGVRKKGWVFFSFNDLKEYLKKYLNMPLVCITADIY